ncbi:unnamed protein product [Phaedon cochleariae]|uniref:SCP domain-containing protein n=1 Tax=Phaedon cochleariae TaxID=80249 RepID=A0A9N9X6R5_PHACE|nr:unnamed protein product [Phaedon cochleariae]
MQVMMGSVIFYCFFVIYVAVNIANATGDKYCRLPCYQGTHTVCNREKKKCGPEPKCGPDFRVIKLKDDERQAILDLHNQLRNKVALGQEGKQPSASNMRALSYNRELEFVAQCWANACNGNPLKHDDCRSTTDFENVGQNLARRSSTSSAVDVPKIIKDFIMGWYNEVNEYDPSSVSGSGLWSSSTGHYTQMVWADTTEVGCAVSYYSAKNLGRKWYSVLLACNYGPAGNYLGRPVYITGSPATGCPGGRPNRKYKGLCGGDKSLKETKIFRNDFFNVTI